MWTQGHGAISPRAFPEQKVCSDFSPVFQISGNIVQRFFFFYLYTYMILTVALYNSDLHFINENRSKVNLRHRKGLACICITRQWQDSDSKCAFIRAWGHFFSSNYGIWPLSYF